MAQTRLMTADELLDYRNEPYRQELIEGILHEMEPPGAQHGAVAMRIGVLLVRHVEDHDLGIAFLSEVGFLLGSDPDTVRAPDVSFVAAERVAEIGIPRGYWPGPPDLAIEVVSPNDRRTDVEAKALVWLASGTRAVVVLDPRIATAAVYRRRAEVRILAGGESLDLDDVIPGFRTPVGDLFA